MHRIFSPEATLYALAIAAILSLIPGKKRKKANHGSTARAKEEQPFMSTMQRIVDEHAGYTAEVFQLYVSGRSKVRIISRLIPSNHVDLKLIDDDVWVMVNGTKIETPLLPDNSRLPQILTEHIDYDACLGGREVQVCTPTLEIVSIIVFYKIDGVPPTKVDLR